MSDNVRSFELLNDGWYKPFYESGADVDHIGRLFLTTDKGVGAKLIRTKDAQVVEIKHRSREGLAKVVIPISAEAADAVAPAGERQFEFPIDYGFEAQIERVNTEHNIVLKSEGGSYGSVEIRVAISSEVARSFFDDSAKYPHLYKTRCKFELEDGTKGEVDRYDPPHFRLAVVRLAIDEEAEVPDLDFIGKEITDSPALPDAVIACNPLQFEDLPAAGVYRSL